MAGQPAVKRRALGLWFRRLFIWGLRLLAVGLWIGGGLWLMWALWRVYTPAPGLAGHALVAAGAILVGVGAAVGVQHHPWGGVGFTGVLALALAAGLLWLDRRAAWLVHLLPVIMLLTLMLYGMARARSQRRPERKPLEAHHEPVP